MTLANQIRYIRKNFGEIPVRLMAKETGLSRSGVCRMAQRLHLTADADSIRELRLRPKENPNPITPTTLLIIQQYHKEGCSPELIAYTLGRPEKTVRKIMKLIENRSRSQ